MELNQYKNNLIFILLFFQHFCARSPDSQRHQVPSRQQQQQQEAGRRGRGHQRRRDHRQPELVQRDPRLPGGEQGPQHDREGLRLHLLAVLQHQREAPPRAGRGTHHQRERCLLQHKNAAAGKRKLNG